MKKSLHAYKSLSNIKILSFLGIKRLFSKPYKAFIALLLFLLICFVSKSLFLKEEKLKIAITIEDDSDDISMFISNFERTKVAGSIDIEYLSFIDAKKKLDAGDLLAIFKVPKNTSGKLYSGKKAKIQAVFNKRNIKSIYLAEYLDDMVELFNLSQSKALEYLDVLRRDSSLSEKEVSEKFNKLSSRIFFAFLTRASVIREEVGIEINYLNRFISILSFLFIIFTVSFTYSKYYEDYFYGMRTRLLSFSYTPFEYSTSWFLISILINTILISIMVVFIRIFLSDTLHIINFSDISTFIVISIFFSLIYEFFASFKFFNGHLAPISIIILILFSSLFKINNYLPNFFSKIIDLNFVSIFANLIKGYRLSFQNTCILFIWLFAILLALDLRIWRKK